MAQVTTQITFTGEVDLPDGQSVEAMTAALKEHIGQVDATLSDLRDNYGPVSINAQTPTDSVSEERA